MPDQFLAANRRYTEVVFSLEMEGVLVRRKVLPVRVCIYP
jgi:hypothetical protein